MKKEHIDKLKKKLVQVNPLGKNAILISDLDDYETEAIDILFLVEKRHSRNKVEKIIREVFEEAFSFHVEINDYSEITDLVMVLKNEF